VGCCECGDEPSGSGTTELVSNYTSAIVADVTSGHNCMECILLFVSFSFLYD
jgi:hypothetical protein